MDGTMLALSSGPKKPPMFKNITLEGDLTP
jgi:hypothetical protein